MKIDNYVYEISVDEIIPPIGGEFRYAAKLLFFGLPTKKGLKKLDHGIGEVQGRTRDEAQLRLKKYINKWIREQNKI